MNCQRTDCTKPATKQIKFNILAKVGDAPVTALPGIYCCDEHATEQAANDFLIDNIPGRRQIEDQFDRQGLARPDWTRSWAKWVSI